MLFLSAITCIPLLTGGCADGGADLALGGTGEGTRIERRANDAANADLAAAGAPNVLRVRSASGQPIANQPLQFGRPFVQGEIPQCPRVLINGVLAEASQVDVKSRHGDGSVRFAVVSAVLPAVSPSGDLSVSFTDGPCAAPAGLSPSEMLAPGFDFDARMTLNGGDAGKASARDILSRGHYTLWTQGPVVTTAIIADHAGKSSDMGSDAYKSLRPVFEVQFWPSIAKTRVRVILEATDTEKVQNQTYDLSVQTGASSPVTVMTASGVNHNFMSRWSRVFWTGGAPAGVDIDYGLAYLARTQALPNYDASIRLTDSTKQSTLDAWAAAPKGLFEKGLWQKDMTVAGGRPDLGPYPKWMVSWLYDGSAALKDVALGQADLAASWPMHLREGNAAKFADRGRTLSALGRPLSGYARPTLAYTSLGYNYTRAADRVNVVGERSGNGWVPDIAHQPQPFFIPYLLTGEHFYYEQLQFWAGFSLLDTSGNGYGEYCYSRNVSPEYLAVNGQLRGIAWGFRMLSEAAWAAADADKAAHTWLRDAVEDTITRFEGARGVVRGENTSRPDWQWANSKGDCTAGRLSGENPLRYWERGNTAYGSTNSVARYEATWQYSFMMYSLNRAYELGFPAHALREWFAPFFVNAANYGGLIGYHLADYKIPVLDAQTGTFYSSWDALHAEYAGYDLNTRWAPSSKPNSNSSNNLDQGYATAALTALAGTAGLPGSDAAWESFASSHYAGWGWATNPKWAILPRGMGSEHARPSLPVPPSFTSGSGSRPWAATPIAARPPSSQPPSPPAQSTPGGSSDATSEESPASDPETGALPAWLSSAKVFEWRAVPGSRLEETEAWTGYKGAAGNMGKAGILSYSGGVIRTKTSELFIAGGGHLDYAGNEIFSIGLASDSPVWTRRIDPSTSTPWDTSYYPDGRPASRHTYRNLAYSEALDRIIFFGGAPWGNQPIATNLVDTFDPNTNEYGPPNLITSAPRTIGGPVGTGMAANGDFYIHQFKDNHLYKWQQSSNTWFDLGPKGTTQYDTPYAVDTKRNRLFRIPWGSYPARIYDLQNAGALSNVELRGPAAPSIDQGASLVYDPVVDVYWLWKRNDANLYRIDAETFEATVQPVDGILPKVAYKDARHRIYGRFNYVPKLRGLVFMLDHETDVMFIRTAP
ncbi:hypothetical protein [Quisquiliibacterium transsilvanicum]|uniref:Uncharacterized protein n=1 Tax=Quisquiliibacterium transsilvanicum TaxID=1549638 RepID=A0A7W8HDM4_9BURK|nr:hypothetical protein [Quisquiliibacterium transsilvanicum]MBB5270035.1 hypothetical protein [Quisquiliibacterium transsilvanicum]